MKTPKPTQDKQQVKRKGPSREIALANLAKAHAKKRDPLVIPSDKISSDIISHDNDSYEQRRNDTLETSEYIMVQVGKHVRHLVQASGSSALLRQAYKFKSLTDAYQNLTRLVYPLGLHKSEGSHLTHLLGSVLPDLKHMLQVNIQVNTTPRVSSESLASPVVVSRGSSGMTHANASVVPDHEGMGPPLGAVRIGEQLRQVNPHGSLPPPYSDSSESLDS